MLFFVLFDLYNFGFYVVEFQNYMKIKLGGRGRGRGTKLQRDHFAASFAI